VLILASAPPSGDNRLNTLDAAMGRAIAISIPAVMMKALRWERGRLTRGSCPGDYLTAILNLGIH
jgi:hypothetical protein